MRGRQPKLNEIKMYIFIYYILCVCEIVAYLIFPSFYTSLHWMVVKSVLIRHSWYCICVCVSLCLDDLKWRRNSLLWILSIFIFVFFFFFLLSCKNQLRLISWDEIGRGIKYEKWEKKEWNRTVIGKVLFNYSFVSIK